MTQMVSAATLKKQTENQSMAADRLRLRVGRAKAASTAMAGTASMRARSDAPMATQAATPTRALAAGTAMCRSAQWLRQRHRVHSASGQAGQVNQASRRSSRTTSCGDA